MPFTYSTSSFGDSETPFGFCSVSSTTVTLPSVPTRYTRVLSWPPGAAVRWKSGSVKYSVSSDAIVMSFGELKTLPSNLLTRSLRLPSSVYSDTDFHLWVAAMMLPWPSVARPLLPLSSIATLTLPLASSFMMRDGKPGPKVKSEKYSVSLIHTGPSYKPGSLRVLLAAAMRVAVSSPDGALPVQAAGADRAYGAASTAAKVRALRNIMLHSPVVDDKR